MTTKETMKAIKGLQQKKVSEELKEIISYKEQSMRSNALSIRNYAEDISNIDSNAASKAIDGIIQYLEEIKNSL